MPTLIDYSYCPETNQTAARIATSQFTEWYTISGHVAMSAVLLWLKPVIDRRIAEVK